jgi:hypothetical protein
MPSMALLFRNRGLPFSSFFSYTFGGLSSLWSRSKSTRKGTYADGTFGSKGTHGSSNGDWSPESGTYVNMESGNHHELGRFKGVNTHIQAGGHGQQQHQHQLSDDRIHLKYGIVQESDVADKHSRKHRDF